MASAVMGAVGQLCFYRRAHFGVIVPEDQRAMAAEIVHIFVAINIPFARTIGVIDINLMGAHVPPIMGDTAGHLRTRILRKLCRCRRLGKKKLLKRGVGRMCHFSMCHFCGEPLFQ